MKLSGTMDLYATVLSTLPEHGHPEEMFPNRAKQRKGGPDKGGIVSAKKKKRKAKTLTTEAAGGQSEGSSKVSRSYRVTDGMGRVLHKFRTKEEADEASAGNRYTRVVSQIPADKTPEVRDMARKRLITPVKTYGRRSLPYPNGPFPAGPMS